MDCPSPCITDTNIWIDLYRGGLLAKVFLLPYRFIVPDVIIAELDEPSGAYLLSLGLQEHGFSGEQISQVQALVRKHRGVSPNDLFALVLARELKATLLTGDQLLRKVAKKEGVSIRGTLWILDELVTHAIVTPRRAAEALKLMINSGRRLPHQECQARLRRWERGE
jgi:predicted nucleic acid-binding protein